MAHGWGANNAPSDPDTRALARKQTERSRSGTHEWRAVGVPGPRTVRLRGSPLCSAGPLQCQYEKVLGCQPGEFYSSCCFVPRVASVSNLPELHPDESWFPTANQREGR